MTWSCLSARRLAGRLDQSVEIQLRLTLEGSSTVWHSDNLSTVMPTMDDARKYPPALDIRSSTAQAGVTPAAGTAEGDLPSSSLRGRTATAPPSGPRVPFRQWLAEMFDSIVRCFRPANAEGGRVRPPQPEAVPTVSKATQAFDHSIREACNTIKSAVALPMDIRAALRGAEHAADILKQASGRERRDAALGSVEQALLSFSFSDQGFSEQDLAQVAKALRGPKVAEAQKGLGEDHLGAERLLMLIEAKVNDHLIDKLEAPVRAAIGAALDSVRDNVPSERIADLFHHALDSAVPLAKFGAIGLSREDQLEVDRLVMRQLAALPEDDQKAILQNVRYEDLTRLSARAQDLIGRLEKFIRKNQTTNSQFTEVTPKLSKTLKHSI